MAGLAFSGTAIAGRVVAIPDDLLQIVREPVAWALVGYGLIGILVFSIALQRGSVTTTNAMLFAVETVVPTLVGVVLLGDRARAGTLAGHGRRLRRHHRRGGGPGAPLDPRDDRRGGRPGPEPTALTGRHG